jgi:hypothetical protein
MDKKKLILAGLTVIILGTAVYSTFHKHKGDFEVCLLCGKQGLLGLLGGFTLALTIHAYRNN